MAKPLQSFHMRAQLGYTCSMENNIDHLFGDLDRPPKSDAYHRARLHGLHHYSACHASAESLIFSASSSSDLPIIALFLQTLDGEQYAFQQKNTRWDTALWLFLHEWQLELPFASLADGRPYRIYAQLGDGTRLYADNGAICETEATLFRLALPRESSEWIRRAIIYQVFVDRFNPGEGHSWAQDSDLRRPFGGRIAGVTEKLPYLRQMGFNAVWLTPIFQSPSHHGYDCSDYARIEPRLGNEDDLKRLLERAHALKMRVILDFVANHGSNLHPRVQEALREPADPACAWIKWKQWPAYEAFYDVQGMPEWNLAPGSPAREHLLAMAQKYLRLGVDGYRLDYANGPEREFWVDFRRACLAVCPDFCSFGEIVAPADEQASFAGGMDGSLDFLSCQALRETFALGNWPLGRLMGYLQAQSEAFPRGFLRPTFIDNHDMNRFLFTAGGQMNALRKALKLLYLLPGPPIVYYGTECALSQGSSIHAEGGIGFDEAREAMDWSDGASAELGGLLRQMADLRTSLPWLTGARWQCDELNEAQGRSLCSLHGRGGENMRVEISDDDLLIEL